jgi:hypothetical protein
MKIIASNTGGTTYEPVPAGTYIARCFSMVHIGTVMETFQGESKLQNKVRLTWELPLELKVFNEERGEQPYTLGKEFTLSLNEKATLRKFLESWRGKAFTEDEAKSFDISVLLGKPCMLNVIHKVSQKNGKTYAEIASVSPMMKGMNCPDQISDTFIFGYDPYEQWRFDSLPDYLKDKVRGSIEYQAAMSPQHTQALPAVEEAAEDLPF